MAKLHKLLNLTDAPVIKLSADALQGICVKAGDPVNIIATVSGQPKPNIAWKLNNDTILTNTVVSELNSTILNIKFDINYLFI